MLIALKHFVDPRHPLRGCFIHDQAIYGVLIAGDYHNAITSLRLEILFEAEKHMS